MTINFVSKVFKRERGWERGREESSCDRNQVLTDSLLQKECVLENQVAEK